MSFKMADVILRVRYVLPGKRCIELKPTEKMLNAFKSEIIYASKFYDEVLDVFAEARFF